MITVRWFGGAAEAAGTDEETYEPGRLSEVLSAAGERHGPAVTRVIDRCAVLVGGRNTDGEDPQLDDGTVVDVLPPFAGG